MVRRSLTFPSHGLLLLHVLVALPSGSRCVYHKVRLYQPALPEVQQRGRSGRFGARVAPTCGLLHQNVRGAAPDSPRPAGARTEECVLVGVQSTKFETGSGKKTMPVRIIGVQYFGTYIYPGQRHGKGTSSLKNTGNIFPAHRPSFAPPFLHGAKSNVVVLFVLSRPNAAGPWTATSIYDELRCRDTTALKHLMSGYVASPAVSSVTLKLPSIPALCAAVTSKASEVLVRISPGRAVPEATAHSFEQASRRGTRTTYRVKCIMLFTLFSCD